MSTRSDLLVSSAEAIVAKSLFGTSPEGHPVHLFRLGRKNGPSVSISEYGCTLTEINMPDANGRLGNVILGFASLDEYIRDYDYLGATVGRFANRITNGTVKLDGEAIQLTPNIPPHHLHGGATGFNKKYWEGEILSTKDSPSVIFRRSSPDGEEGYPGNLDVSVTFTLHDERELDVLIEARTDRTTPLNLTMHPYFNLAANGGDILDHRLTIHGGRFLPMTPNSLPTGEVRSVEGTPMDFRTSRVIGAHIDEDDEQLRIGGGYDHCWVLDGKRGVMRLVAEAYDPSSGRRLQLATSEPGLQLYTGNALGDVAREETGEGHARRSGFCLEPQVWPDAPNHESFPSAVLHPGETYKHQIRYSFDCIVSE